MADKSRGDLYLEKVRRESEAKALEPTEAEYGRMTKLTSLDPRFSESMPGVGESPAAKGAKKSADIKAKSASIDYKKSQLEPADDGSDYGTGAPLAAGPGAVDTTISGEYYADPAAAAQAQQIQSQVSQARMELAGKRGQLAARVMQNARQMSLEREAAEGIALGGEAEARRRIDLMQQAYDEADIDLASLRVDPKRWEQDTPAIAQVLMALASSAFSFFSGGQGPNPVVQLIENAIDRDMKAQMVNIQNRLKGADLGIEKQEVLAKMEGNLRASMYQRVLNGMEMMAQESGQEIAAMEILQQAQALEEGAMNAHMARLEPYKVQYQQKMAAGGVGGGEPLTPTFVKKMGQDAVAVGDGLQLLTRVGLRIRAGGGENPITGSKIWGWLASAFPNEAFVDEDGNQYEVDSAATLKHAVESMATRIGRATGVDVGNFAQREADRMIGALRGGDWNRAGTIYDNLMEKMQSITKGWLSTAEGLGRTHNISALEPQLQLVREAWSGHDKAMKAKRSK